jgi:RHS repeat-associated protein
MARVAGTPGADVHGHWVGVERVEHYDPFGNVLASANVKGQLGYQSGWTDRSTGNVNMAARWYNPAVGQFMNRDTVSNSPVPNPMEANKFAYVDDNPMTGTDPSGHGWFSDAWSFVSNHVVAPAASFVYHQVIQPAAHFVNTYVVQPIVHVAVASYHVVRDAYHAAGRVVRNAYYHVVRFAKKVYHAAVHVVRTAYHAVARVVKTAAHAVAHAAAASKAISSLRVGDRVANSQPGKTGLETHPADRVIVTETDHDFVDVKVKPSRVRRVAGRVAAGLAVATAVVTGGAATASAAPATLTTTYHHPFYDVTRGEFVEAVDLQVGDRLRTADGGEATVEEVTSYHSTEVTYDLTIDQLHTYYVLAGDTPVLVHNCTPLGFEDHAAFEEFGARLKPALLTPGIQTLMLLSRGVLLLAEVSARGSPSMMGEPVITTLRSRVKIFCRRPRRQAAGQARAG